MTEPVRFALVGCGRIAPRHASLLVDGLIPDASLAAVCDPQAPRASLLGERFAVPSYGDMHQMMTDLGETIDAVLVLTPSGMHADHCIELAAYGKHIVVEKPMALRLVDADRMIAACSDANCMLFVVKQNRLNLPVRKLSEAVFEGRFGRIFLGTVRVRWCRDQAYYDHDAWRGTWELDGGVFANQASHHIDLLEWLLGDVESVHASSTHALADIEVEDTGVAVLRFRSGALGVVEATTATRPKDLEGSISILGERGTVEIGGFAVNEMKSWNFVDRLPGDEEVLATFKENPPDVYGYGHKAYLTNVVQAIRGEAQPLVDGVAGRKSLELITAIYQSIETSSEVALADLGNHPAPQLGLPR